MGRNYYAEAIDLYANGLMRNEALALALLKKHPKILIDLHKGLAGPTKEEQVFEALEQFPGQKIPAIKYVREHLGIGLREAKDFVETHPLFKVVS